MLATQNNDDTIVALSTPWGVGAIAMVRLSGKEAVRVVDGVFVGRVPLREQPSHLQAYGRIVAEKAGTEVTIDEVMVAVHRGPHSYTGEDVVEVTCHGSPLIVREMVQLFCDRGARLAEPGEFTKRAFIHGRIDLAQAEAVCDLIQARTERARQCAMGQLQGKLSEEITNVQALLTEVRSLLELDIDFADDDVPAFEREKVAALLRQARDGASKLLASFAEGHLLREGARVVLVGRTNVGKSSLLNALLRCDRAIVSELPGTTRDTLEAVVDIGGIPVTLVDTAGFGKLDSSIEQEAARRTEREVGRADLIMLVLDRSEPLSGEDERLLQRYGSPGEGQRPAMCVVNKIDVPKAWDVDQLRTFGYNLAPVEVSAKVGVGMERLREVVAQTLLGEAIAGADSVVVTNLRHQQALQRAVVAIDRSLASLEEGLSAEFVAVDVREASEALGTIVGAVTDEDVLAEIFARFCIGK